jgi:flavin-dependent dehydrogenase
MQFDAVIIGGGPAGLAISSELSRNWRVLEETRRRFHAGGDQPLSPDRNPGFDFN